MKKRVLLSFSLLILTGCTTIQGSYDIRAVDGNGKELPMSMRLTDASLGSIRSIRDSYCARFGAATIFIENAESGKPLDSESPYPCKSKKP